MSLSMISCTVLVCAKTARGHEDIAQCTCLAASKKALQNERNKHRLAKPKALKGSLEETKKNQPKTGRKQVKGEGIFMFPAETLKT